MSPIIYFIFVIKYKVWISDLKLSTMIEDISEEQYNLINYGNGKSDNKGDI